MFIINIKSQTIAFFPHEIRYVLHFNYLLRTVRGQKEVLLWRHFTYKEILLKKWLDIVFVLEIV